MSPEGWAPDPWGRHRLRYWDGERWTDYVSDVEIPGVSPAPRPPAQVLPVGGSFTSGPEPSRRPSHRVPLLLMVLVGALVGAVAALVLTVGRMESHTQYPSSVRYSFLVSCVQSGGASDACRCSLQRLERRYSLEEFITFERLMVSTGELPPAVVAIMIQCAEP